MSQDRFLRRSAVLELVGFKTTALYSLIRNDEFPRPIKLGTGLAVWSETEVRAWMAEQAAKPREAA